jgi:hypothetical protein
VLADIHANANGVEPGTPVVLWLSPEWECSSACQLNRASGFMNISLRAADCLSLQ